jgi:hypothetical protein
LVDALWFASFPSVEPMLAEPERTYLRDFVESFRAQRQYVGRTRIGLEFLSFDFQDADHATVTTRERWRDELYQSQDDSGGFGGDVIGVRPPYEVVGTYTMQRQADQWLVSRRILRPDPPAWQQP